MSLGNRWWDRFDKTWRRVLYSDGTKQGFWTRNCGLFTLDVEPMKLRCTYRIGVSSLDGSIENCYHEGFRGSLAEAKQTAMSLAYRITTKLVNRITGPLD